MPRQTELVIPATRGTGLSTAAVNGQSHSAAEPCARTDKPQRKTNGATTRTTRPSATNNAKVAKEKSKPKAQPNAAEKPKLDPGRDFIIAYRDEFIGHYRSGQRLSTKRAFERIAEQLHIELGTDFDVDELELFKPVALASPTPDDRHQLQPGGFRWFHGPESHPSEPQAPNPRAPKSDTAESHTAESHPPPSPPAVEPNGGD